MTASYGKRLFASILWNLSLPALGLTRRKAGITILSMSEDEAANAEQEQIEERLRATEDQLKSLRDSTITRSTWGLFFVLLAVIGLLVFIFLYLLALFSAGASLTPSILVTLISVISLLVGVLLLTNERGLLERARELQRIAKDLQRKVEERSAEDREREGERDRR